MKWFSLVLAIICIAEAFLPGAPNWFNILIAILGGFILAVGLRSFLTGDKP
jgi:xanthine/uracil permease